MTIAMGLDNRMYKPQDIDFVIVQSGATCSPCARLEPMLRRATTLAPGVTEAFEAPGVTLLRRAVNEGMDFASHNTTLTHLLTRAQLSRYRYVFFLNSSIRGPFVPSYLPHGWQWTDTFLSLLNDRVHVVSSSLVCLPEVDAGGYGPKLESWAFAADRDGLDALLQEDLFQVRQCKLCKCVPESRAGRTGGSSPSARHGLDRGGGAHLGDATGSGPDRRRTARVFRAGMVAWTDTNAGARKVLPLPSPPPSILRSRTS